MNKRMSTCFYSRTGRFSCQVQKMSSVHSLTHQTLFSKPISQILFLEIEYQCTVDILNWQMLIPTHNSTIPQFHDAHKRITPQFHNRFLPAIKNIERVGAARKEGPLLKRRALFEATPNNIQAFAPHDQTEFLLCK